MTWDTAQQLLRILLQIGAGVLIQRGLITEEMATTATGALISLAGVGWWVVWNKKPKRLDPLADMAGDVAGKVVSNAIKGRR